jgi:hypothetical protein
MVCWGKTKQGKVRFRCNKCLHTGIKKRPDQSIRRIKILFSRYIIGSTSLKEISKQTHVSIKTITRHFKNFWDEIPTPLIINKTIGLVLDATTIIKRNMVVLVALDPVAKRVISWQFVHRETYESWRNFLSTLPVPIFVVSDAQKGLIKAVNEVFPLTRHQRCITHVIRRSNSWLTHNPKTKAGRELRDIIRLLSQIKTQEQKEIWIGLFKDWDIKYKTFLSEKSQSLYSSRKWYVHRKIRGIRSMILNSMSYLFSFLENPLIPKTSNSVEGGINSPIKDLIRKHRGLNGEKKMILTAHYLKKRQKKYQH